MVWGQIKDKTEFKKLNSNLKWNLVFEDSGKNNWQQNWFLDGEIAKVENTKNGMHLIAGPEFMNDAHHMVLWTNDLFQGDLKIEFDYTRTDSATKCVNILYIQASGKDEGEFVNDISKWNHLRKVPAMRTYFENMNALHLSFAAFPNNEESTDYLRVRRYPILKDRTFKELEVKPTFFETHLFKTNESYHITVIKTDRKFFLMVQSKKGQTLYSWETSHLKPLHEGRIGLRHMYTRSALYKNFKVYQVNTK